MVQLHNREFFGTMRVADRYLVELFGKCSSKEATTSSLVVSTSSDYLSAALVVGDEFRVAVV